MLNLLFGPPRRRGAAADGNWWPVGSGRRTLAGVRVDEDLALTYSAVWCATRVIAETCASLPLLLYRRTSGDGREQATDRPLYSLLKSAPNPGMGSMAFREGRVAHQVNWGNAFAEIERDTLGRPVALWPIHPARVRPACAGDVGPDRRGLLEQGYAYKVRNNDGTSVAMRADELLHVPGVLSDDGVWGRGVIAYARESVGFGLAVERHGAAYFGGGAQPRGIVYGTGLKDPQQRAQFRKEWKEIHGSPDSGEIVLLPKEAEYTPITLSNEDSQFLETRKHNVGEIARWYRLPPHMIGDLERSTNNNIEQQAIEFVVYSILPWLRRWEEQIALKLLSEEERQEYYAEHLLAALLKGDLPSRVNAYRVGVGFGLWSINECRRLENLNGIGPAGDVHYVPLNMTTAERMMTGEAVREAAAGGSDAGPGSDQTGAPDDGGSAASWPREAVLAVATDALRRMLTKEGNAARRRADDRDFPAWLDGFHREHLGVLRDALAPLAGLIGENPAGLAQRVAKRSRAALLSAYDSLPRTAFLQLLDGWAGQAQALADELVPRGRPVPPA